MKNEYVPTEIITVFFDKISEGKQPSDVRKHAYAVMDRLDDVANRSPQEESELMRAIESIRQEEAELMRICDSILGISFCEDKPEVE